MITANVPIEATLEQPSTIEPVYMLRFIDGGFGWEMPIAQTIECVLEGDELIYIPNYFKAYELVDKDTFDRLGAQSFLLFAPEALIMLDDLRVYFGVPITVNNWFTGGPFSRRGFRTLLDELAVNPKSTGHSAHQTGLAFDFDVEGMTAEDVRGHIIADKDSPRLRNITRLEAGTSWVHADCLPLPYNVNRIHLFSA